jgi:hypothetical protein
LAIGFGAALAVYLLASNMLIDFSGWLRHLDWITHEGSIPYQMFPATPAGYAALALRIGHLVTASFGVPAALLGTCGLVWVLARRVPGAALLAFAALAYLVLFPGSILYVLPRFVLPVILVLAVFAGVAAAQLWRTRHGLARLVVLAAVGYSAVYGATMNLGLLWDTRYAAEEWMALNLPPDALVGTDGERTYLPRLPPSVATVPVTVTPGGLVASAATPEYLILSDAHYRRYMRHEETRAVMKRLLTGELDYEPLAVFEQRWMPAAELIPSVAPRIVILRRRDPTGRADAWRS